MRIAKNTWHCKTCECVISFTFDQDLSPEQIQHTFDSVQNKCPAHSGLDGQSLYTALLDDSRKFAFTESAIIENFPRLVNTIVKENGTYKVLKPNIFEWFFEGKDDQRVFNFRINDNLEITEKQTILTYVSSRVGENKIKILGG